MSEFDRQQVEERYNQLLQESFSARRANYRKDALRDQEMMALCRQAVRHGFAFSHPEHTDPDLFFKWHTRQELKPSYLRPLTPDEAEYYALRSEADWFKPHSLFLKEKADEFINRFPERERKQAARLLKRVIRDFERIERKQQQALAGEQPSVSDSASAC